MPKRIKKTLSASPAGRTKDSKLVPLTIHYWPEQLTQINKRAAALGLDRVNFIRSAIAEQLRWESEFETVPSSKTMIAVTVRVPPKMAEAFDKEREGLGLDRSSAGRMWSLRKANWSPK